jgi:hypothetical protein
MDTPTGIFRFKQPENTQFTKIKLVISATLGQQPPVRLALTKLLWMPAFWRLQYVRIAMDPMTWTHSHPLAAIYPEPANVATQRSTRSIKKVPTAQP